MSTKTGESLRHIYLNLEFNLFQTLKKLFHGFFKRDLHLSDGRFGFYGE